MDIFQMYGIAKPTMRQRDERMTPEEEKQVTESLGQKALGTVGAVGNSLDLPGSVVRDLATWLPGGMKAQNPFDQLLTPFNDSNRVSGRDLNRSYGLAGKQDNWANFAGGMGTEIALDPLTYLTFGGSALGKGGQVAKSAGLLKKAPEVLARRTGRNLAEVGAREARVGLSLRELLGELGPEATKAAEIAAKGKKLNLDDLLDQKLGGNVGINLPFMDPSFTVGGSTKAAAAVDKFARDMRYMTIPGTDFAPINALMNQFQVKTGGMATPLGAKLAEKAFDAKTQNRSQVDLVINKYANQLKDLGYDSATGGRMLRRMMEVEGLRKNAPAEMIPMLDEMRSVLEEMPAIAKDWGINLKEFVDDDLSYFPRQYTREVRNAKGADSARVLNGRQINAARRKEFLRGDGLETESIIKLGQDEDINAAIANGAKASEIADMIKSKYGSEIPEKYKVIAKTGENAGKEVERDRYKALARWLGTLSPEGRKSGIFGNHALYDLQARMVSAGDAKVAAETVVDFLTQPGLLKKTPDGLDKQGMMSVNQVLKRTGLNIGDSTGGIGKQIAIKMGHDLSQLPPEQANKVIASIGKASIDGKTADEITRFVESFKSPDQASQLLDLVNGASNLWKGALTTPWPSFHVRNLISGQWANASAGLWSADSVKDSVTLTRGGVVKGAKDIPAVQAEWAKRQGLPSSGSSAMLDANNWFPQGFQEQMDNPLSKDMTTNASVSDSVPDVWHPESFSKISAHHKIFNDKLARLQNDGALKNTDADILRLAFSGASEEGLSRLNMANMEAADSILTKDGQKAAGKWSWQVGDNGLLEFNIQVAKNLPQNQSSLSVLLHELGHQAQWSYKQIPGNELGGEFSALVSKSQKNDRLLEYMKGVHGEKLGEYLATTFDEQFPQLFADSILRRKVPQGALGKIITTVRDWIVQFLERIKLTKPLPKPTQSRIDEIIDALMGFDGSSMEKLSQKDAAKSMQKLSAKHGEQYMMKAPQLTDEEATKILGEMASAYRVVGKFDASDTVGLGSKIDNQVAHNLDDMISGIPGEGRKSFSATRTAKKAAGLEQGTSPWKFWANRGVGGRSKSEFGPMAAGEEVGFATEAMNRLSPWLHQIKQGVDPQHAADTVGAIQVQYSNRYYTKAEQQILGNLFPFYKFSRSMVPYLINQVLEHPGGATANTIRTMENAHDPAQFTPDHVRESAAIPINGSPLEAVLGKVPAGHDRYISGLGLPVEELMGFGPSPRAAGLEVMSRLNPAIKAPIEYFTGQSFFQKTPTGGRPLDTMDPPTGRLLANLSGQKEPVRFPGQTEADILLSNSPFSKVISSLNMATDTRRGPVEKAVNMLTGVRTKDVTPATKDTLERDTLNQAMKEFQAKQFTRTYIPDSVRATMTPEQQRQADLYEQMAALLADRAKARKEAAQAEEQQKLRASR